MPKSLQEYVDWLDNRDLIWPAAPDPVPVKATPYLKPLEGIQAVTWSIYGTLLRISDGRLLHMHPQQLRMQIALEKTIEEFNMWNSMSRKPGAPWEYMLQQYKNVLEEMQMAGTKRKSDFPEANSARLWKRLLERLEQNEYEYDESFYGDLEDLSEKVAYFFHANLQGVEADPGALRTLTALAESGLKQAFLADAQPFTLVQTLRALKEQGKLPPLGNLFASECFALSYQEEVRKPSVSLYRASVERFQEIGISPGEVLHVGTRLKDDLASAKKAGMRTVLLASDKTALEATSAELKNPDWKPDRLMTELSQIREILAVG